MTWLFSSIRRMPVSIPVVETRVGPREIGTGESPTSSKAIELSPKFAEAYVLRGWSLLCSNRDGAEADARAYLALQDRPTRRPFI